MARTLSFTIPGAIDTIVTVVEGDFDGDGFSDLKFTVSADTSGGLIADLRGLFWDVEDDDVSGWSVYEAGDPAGESPDVTDSQFLANAVKDLGNGANLKGAITKKGNALDAGVEIGTQGIGKDDVQTTSFVIRSPGEDLTLDDIGGQRFGVRYTSFGEQGGPREGSLKIAGRAPHAPDAVDDEARTIAESPTGFAVDIDVLANDDDDDGDALTVTSVDGAGSDGGTFSINPDGTVRFDPGADFDDLNTGEFRTTSSTYHVSDGNGGTDCAVVTVTVEGFDPGEQTNTESNGDIALSFTTAERTIDGTSPASAKIALPDADSDVAFIIDVSGSTTATPFSGSVGDVNGDGDANEVLDAEIAAYLHLLDEMLVNPAGTVHVNLISFASGASNLGTFEVTDSAGETALRAKLTGLNGGGATNFEAPLQIADGFFDGMKNEVAYFLSDGFQNVGGSWADEVASMTGKGVDIVAVGVGAGSSLAQLNTVDNTGGAQQVLDADALTAALLESPFDVIDFRIEVDGAVVAGIDESDLIETPLGFNLPEQLLMGLETGENDVNSVIAYADISTDGDDSDAEVFLQVENLIDGVVYDELLV